MSQLAVTGNGGGTGVFTLSSPNSNTNRTLTLPDNTGTLLSTKSAGTILQVVQGTYSTFTSLSSAVLTDLGLSASITPSSTTSKILVFANICGIYSSASNCYARFVIDRSGTSLINFGSASSYNSAGSGGCDAATAYLDSPSSASSLTYKIKWGREGSGQVNANNSSSSAPTAGTSTITLMEIAA